MVQFMIFQLYNGKNAVHISVEIILQTLMFFQTTETWYMLSSDTGQQPVSHSSQSATQLQG
jgi:hypothetical protein